MAAALTLLGLFFPASATTVVIRRTPTGIFAAADSKVIHPSGQADSLTDKIVKVNDNWYFAAAGKYELGISFNVFRSVRFCTLSSLFPVITITQTMREFADSCTKRIAQEFYPALRAFKEARPDLYATHIANRVFLQVVFFGEEDGQLKVYARDIFPDALLLGTSRIVPTDCADIRCWAVIAIGFYDHVFREFMSNPRYWKAGQEPAQICRLVALEIEKHPADVGWPIRVLHLSAGGKSEWFTHENACETKKPQQRRATKHPRRKTRSRL